MYNTIVTDLGILKRMSHKFTLVSLEHNNQDQAICVAIPGWRHKGEVALIIGHCIEFLHPYTKVIDFCCVHPGTVLNGEISKLLLIDDDPDCLEYLAGTNNHIWWNNRCMALDVEKQSEEIGTLPRN